MRRYVTFSRNNLAPVHMGSDRFLWHLGTMTATHIWAASVQSKTGHAARRRKIYIRILVRLGVLWRQERTSLPCCGMEHGMTEVNLYGNIVSASVDDPCFQHIHFEHLVIHDPSQPSPPEWFTLNDYPPSKCGRGYPTPNAQSYFVSGPTRCDVELSKILNLDYENLELGLGLACDRDRWLAVDKNSICHGVKQR